MKGCTTVLQTENMVSELLGESNTYMVGAFGVEGYTYLDQEHSNLIQIVF